METYMLIIYGLLAGWTIFSLYYIYRVWTLKDTNKIVPYVYDSIPTVFTTLGILGTFVGIYFGLRQFNVNDVTASIPSLLEGLKTAFTTSIWGISLSLIFGKSSQIVLREVEMKAPPKPTDELAALQEMTLILKESKDQNNSNFNTLNRSLIGDKDDSLSTQLVRLRNQFTELETKYDKQYQTLEKVQQALGGDGETSLLTQIQKLRAEQNEYSNQTNKNIDWIVESMNKNNELISRKFDEFSELLAKNNTEALVEVMKRATEEFNAQMSDLIEKLVQENFQELNNSVQRMNQWQQENKEMIQSLTDQFKKVSIEFAITATAIKDITENTTKLTDENSHLTKLIEELQKVMVDDTKFQEIVGKLTSTVDTLKENTEAFDETTNKLNNWVRNQMNFSDIVAKLLTRLEEIEKIKDINQVFWDNTKKQLNEGVGVIEKASKRLSNDLENINAEFYERLNDTLQNLDTLIQRIIANYKR
jgi:chromosome segregation ATPase